MVLDSYSFKVILFLINFWRLFYLVKLFDKYFLVGFYELDNVLGVRDIVVVKIV